MNRTSIIAATVAAGTLITATGCSLPTSADTSSPSPSPSSSTPYNAGDAAALVAAATLALGTPNGAKNPDQVKPYIAAVDATKTDPANPMIDTGYRGAQIVEAVITDKGSADPVCFAVKSSSLNGLQPGQPTWVMYFAPPIQGDPNPFVYTDKGITTCADAQKAVAALQSDVAKRQQVSVTAQKLLQSAFLSLPVADLTRGGQILFDTLRGEKSQETMAPTPTSQPTATPTVTGSPSPFSFPTVPGTVPPSAPTPQTTKR